jgi:lactoylglutathione lyase
VNAILEIHMSTKPAVPSGAQKRAEPMSFRARTLSASLTAKDLNKSLAWYRDVVGFTVDQKHERDGKLMAVSLKAGDVRILIGQDDGGKGWDRIKGEGFSLQITTAQNIDEVAQRIKQRGGTLATEPTDMPWGARVFRLQDPDGFKLVISSEK